MNPERGGDTPTERSRPAALVVRTTETDNTVAIIANIGWTSPVVTAATPIPLNEKAATRFTVGPTTDPETRPAKIYLLSVNRLQDMILRTVAALFGIVEMLLPKKVVEKTMDLITVGEPEYEFKSWVYALTRLEGFVILIFALLWSSESHDE